MKNLLKTIIKIVLFIRQNRFYQLSSILIPSLFLIFPSVSNADKAQKLNNKGIKSYQNQQLEESVQLFTEALVERPESPELRFNRGTALSSIGKPEEAFEELEKAANISENKELSASAHFNAGNTHFAGEDLKGAIEEYKKAVKLDQSSRDIRYNLELALKKLQEQQENQDDDQKEENKNEEKQNQDEKESKKDQDENENMEQQKNQNQQQQQQNQQQQENEQQPMTPEEAQRILDAINDEEKKAFELRKMMVQEDMRQGDDW